MTPTLTSTAAALIRRDLRLLWRRRGDALQPVLFALLVVVLFALAVGGGDAQLARNAAAVLWLAVLLAGLLALDGLFRGDAEDGSLEQWLLAPVPLAWLVLVRTAVHWLATTGPLLLALPLGLAWFREPPAEEIPAEISAGGGLVGVSFAEAAKDRRFWTIWLSIALVALAYGGAHIHMPEIIKQHGLTAKEGAGIMGMIGIALLSGRIVTGWLLDRIWAPLVCLPILSIPALACFWLMGSSTSEPMVWASAFLLGFAAGAESDLIAYLASRYFGMAHYGKIYGMLYMPFGIFSAISPVLYGRIRDTTGSYDQMLMAATILFVAGALLLLTLGRSPVFTAKEASA